MFGYGILTAVILRIHMQKRVLLKGLKHLSAAVLPSGVSLLACLALDCTSKGSGN